MLEAVGSPLRLWGYGLSLQSISLTPEGLIIRNGTSQVLVPTEDISHFQEQLAVLMVEGGAKAEQSSEVRGA
ncbi:MAG: hypothetical protein BMS9Abin09_0506 [Gammaproteobacteria bacterium]|nr:MAG: hypothetical protein BMS9Abin09_0506 [Gammaproteobacteria bacterium]